MMLETRTARQFVWHDLDSPDPDRVLGFYSEVMGWTPEPYSGGPMRYWMWMLDGVPVGGIGELTAEARDYGARPGWNGYVESPDVDRDVERVVALGGRIRIAPATLETVGRMAVVEDPQGAGFTLFAADPSMTPAASDRPDGRFAWRDLATSDPEEAWTFYIGLFGWKEGRRIQVGQGGPYRTFAAGDVEIGGIVKSPSARAAPASWVYYVQVRDIGEAVRRVGDGGGEVVGGIVDVPLGRAAHCEDPEGAAFGLYEHATGRREP
jgi:predicted enzyme related to lactoylglutathione lyase